MHGGSALARLHRRWRAAHPKPLDPWRSYLKAAYGDKHFDWHLEQTSPRQTPEEREAQRAAMNDVVVYTPETDDKFKSGIIPKLF